MRKQPKRRLHIHLPKISNLSKEQTSLAEPAGFPDAGTAAMTWGIAPRSGRRNIFFLAFAVLPWALWKSPGAFCRMPAAGCSAA